MLSKLVLCLSWLAAILAIIATAFWIDFVVLEAAQLLS